MYEDTKPGWKTTEFWGSVAGYAAGAAALFGYIPQENVDPFIKGVTQIAGGAMMVVTVVGYAWSRARAKMRK